MTFQFQFSSAIGGSSCSAREMEYQRVDRKELSYENLSHKYQLKSRDFSRQYAHIYFVRLEKFRPILQDRAIKKWGKKNTSQHAAKTLMLIPTIITGKKYEIKSLAELEPNEKAIVIGTLYKQQELKPSILREISEEVWNISIYCCIPI